jgi:PTH1 family peptidyl-tRNA hydrolase
MWLIVGLGNPGDRYTWTRHNIGFLALDMIQKICSASGWHQEHKAQTCKVRFAGTDLLLAKPQTFMNLSGESVVALMNFYKIPQEQLIVLHDEIDIPFQHLRFHKNRGAGGHNGIKSISALMGTNDYTRLKLGVGRPPHPSMSPADYVLQKFNDMEMQELGPFLQRSAEALQCLLQNGLNKASSLFNGGPSDKQE